MQVNIHLFTNRWEWKAILSMTKQIQFILGEIIKCEQKCSLWVFLIVWMICIYACTQIFYDRKKSSKCLFVYSLSLSLNAYYLPDPSGTTHLSRNNIPLSSSGEHLLLFSLRSGCVHQCTHSCIICWLTCWNSSGNSNSSQFQ